MNLDANVQIKITTKSSFKRGKFACVPFPIRVLLCFVFGGYGNNDTMIL